MTLDQDITAEHINKLVAARDAYQRGASEHYDEALIEVSVRIAASGSLSKADIGGLIIWKRLQATPNGPANS